MTAVETISQLAGDQAAWAGLAAGGWLVAGLIALVAVWQAARADRVCLRAAEAAHELRGPLCAARLALDSLGRAFPDAPRLARGIGAVDLELCRAGLALDELGRLDSRKASVGAVSPSSAEPVDLNALAAAAEPAWRALAAACDTTLELRTTGGAALVAGDVRRLHQGIGNLVANACEHGSGPVRVAVVTGERVARVEVSDGGPGPSTGMVERARRRAGRRGAAGATASRRGHGLAIAARVAREGGGRLRVESSPQGSMVTLELSLDQPSGVALRRRLGRARRLPASVSPTGPARATAGIRSPLARAR